VALETGFNARGADFSWAYGFAGSRFSWVPATWKSLSLAIDGEVGLGLGSEGLDALGVFSTGAYTGPGVAFRVGPFATYARARLEVALSKRTLGMISVHSLAGIEFSFNPVTFGLSAGEIQTVLWSANRVGWTRSDRSVFAWQGYIGMQLEPVIKLLKKR
jgi:hypothetical protein